MPTFEIPDGPTTVELKRAADATATGSIVFNVTNKSSDSCAGRLSVVPSGSSKEAWFTIDGDRERTFASGETQTATIKVTAPKDVAAGDYPFRLRAVAVNDPDNDHVEGPVATAKVPAPPVVGQKKSLWWLWLIIALVVLIVLGVGGYFIVKSMGGEKETETPAKTVDTTKTGAVPDFTTGKTVEQAKVEAAGFDIVEVAGEPTGKPPRTIISQNPKGGTTQPQGSLVKVTFDPGVDVPALPGNATFATAPNALRSAKLEPGQFMCDRALSGRAPDRVGQVTGFSPASGTRVAANSTVNMTAVQATPCLRIFIQPRIFMQLPQAQTLSVQQKTAIMRLQPR
ncbi:MAG TPA: PASTA domain-containing protein [Sphingomicrobium sp.]|nr:PASTA domain-containing protein [Sphingomicrobium sp.]